MSDAPAEMSAACAVGIVNHDTAVELGRLLDALHEPEAPLPVVVVDNASTDGSVAMVRRDHPGVLVVECANRGFAAGVNEAIGAAAAEVVIVLNSDTIIDVAGVRALAAAMMERPRAAVVAPGLVGLDGAPQHNAFVAPTVGRFFVQDSGLGPLLARVASVPGLRGRGVAARMRAVARGVEADTDTPDWVLGAAFAVRSDAWRAVGGMDEDYFLYFEEVDFCARVRAGGWSVHALSEPRVVHVGGASTNRRRWPLLRRYFASRARYVAIHDPDRLTSLRVITVVIAGAKVVRDVVVGPDRLAAARAWLGVISDALHAWPEER